MTSLAQMSQILNKTEASLNSYAKVFNNTSEEIIKDTEAMGSSALELRDQVNRLIKDAQGLKKIGITLDKNNNQQVEEYILKIKELDNVVSNIAPSIGANLKALNINIEKEFRLADGINEETGKVKYRAGYLKEELNDLASIYKESFLRENVERLAPNLLGFADNFVKEVDKIEYQMGRITEFGSLRSESEKALGFTVERRDIDDIIYKRQQELEELNINAMNYGYSSYREEDYLALFPEIREEIETTDNYIKQLEGSIGKYITGYIEMFNSALDLSKSGQSYQPMFEAIGDGMANILYGEQDWNSMTPAKFKKLEEDDEIDGWDEFNSSGKETEKVATQVEETVRSASKAIDNSGESLEKVTKSARNYTEELNKLLQSNNLLSEEQTQGILSKDYSSQIKRYKDNLEFIKQDLKSFGDIKLADKAEVILDSSNTSDATKLLGYTSRVEEDLEKLKELTKQREELFNNLNNPEYVNRTNTNPISKEYLNDIKSTLESGYKVNLLDGSSDKEKLDRLREGYLQLIESFKNPEINLVTDTEIEDLNKLNALQKAISDETQRQNNISKAKEDYEKDKIKYAEQYNKLAQANLNIDTLRADRDRLAEKANSRKEHTRYEDIFNSKTGLYEKKEIKYSDRDIIKEQYNKEISRLNNERNSLEKSINSLKDKFEKSGLEVPVVPTLKLSPKLGAEFKKNRLGLLKEDLNNTLGEGGIGKYKDALSNITKQADELGINISKSLGRVNAIGNSIKKAFSSGDIEKAKGLVEVYGSEIDKLNNKVLGQAKAQNIAKEKQREAQTKLYREALEYQSNQASLGNKISDKEYVNYLRQQAEEYKRLGGAVENYQRLITKANELEKKTYEDSLKAAKDKVNGVLSTVKSLADGVSRAIDKIVSIIRQGVQLVTRTIKSIINVVGKIGSTITNIIKLFGNLGNRIRQTFAGGSNQANIFKNSITELNSKLTLLKNIYNAVFNNQFIAKGKNLLNSLSTLKVVIGEDLTNNTIEWAQGLERALGVSATELIADLKEISAVLKGLGMEAKDVQIGAQNFGLMSRYMGAMGLAGGDADQVMSKLTSGMKGMTAAIDDLGLSVRDSEMNYFLKRLKSGAIDLNKVKTDTGEVIDLLYNEADIDFSNMAEDFSALNEEARVYVRNMAIAYQFASKYDIKNYVEQLNTVTGTIGTLKDTWASLSTTIGVAFAKIGAYIAKFLIPLVKKLETYVKGWIVNLQAFLNRVGAFFNIDLNLGLGEDVNANLNDVDTSGTDKAKESTDELAESLEEVSKKAKEAKGSLQGFDRVNNVSTNDGSSGDIEFDYKQLSVNAFDIFTDEIAEANKSFFEQLEENMSNTFTNIKNKLKEIIGEDTINSITKFFETIKEKAGQALRVLFGKQTLDDLVYMNSEDTIWADILNVIDTIPERTKRAIDMVKQLLDVVFNDTNNLNTVVEMNSGSAWGSLLRIIKTLKEIFKDLFKSFNAFMKEEGLPWLKQKLDELADWVEDNKEQIKDLIKKVADFAWDAFKIFVELVAELVKIVVENPEAVKNFFLALAGTKIVSGIVSLVANMGLMFLGLKNFLGLVKGALSSGLLAKLGTALGTAGTAVANGATALASRVGASKAGGALVAGASKAGPLALIAGLVAGLVKSTESMWDNGLGYDTKSLFSGNFGETMYVKELNEWAAKYYAYMELYSEKTGVQLDTLRDDTLAYFRQTLEESGTYSAEAVELMMEQFATQLDNRIEGDMSTWSDYLFGTKKEAEEWAQSVWDSAQLAEQGITQSTGNIGASLDEVIYGFDYSTEQVAAGMEASTARIGASLDEVLGLTTTTAQEVAVEAPVIGENIIKGVETGLETSKPSLLERVKNIFGLLIDAAKLVLGIHSPSTIFSDIGGNIVSGLLNGIKGGWSNLTTSVKSLFTDLLSTVKEKAKSLWDNITAGINDISTNVQTTITSKTKASTGRNIFGFANGGSIAGGQLFVANENGQPELIGKISGRSGTNVANNNMIVEAMKAGVFEAVYNANAEIANQTRGNSMNSGNANIKIEGFGLIDQSTLRELARMLAPYMNSNSKNIADVNFTI